MKPLCTGTKPFSVLRLNLDFLVKAVEVEVVVSPRVLELFSKWNQLYGDYPGIYLMRSLRHLKSF